MKEKPTREEVRSLIQALQQRDAINPHGGAGSAATAIYCQVNEGIAPPITAKLRYQDFHFGQRWVEFSSSYGGRVVRRPLSDETGQHLKARMIKLKARAADLIQSYVPPTPQVPRKRKNGAPGVSKPVTWYRVIQTEIDLLGFDVKRFGGEALKWVWLDEHPHDREEEIRINIVAGFILRWAKVNHQEALFRLLFRNTSVLRPSWAYPDYNVGNQRALGIIAKGPNAPIPPPTPFSP